jgi:hypothetical protein
MKSRVTVKVTFDDSPPVTSKSGPPPRFHTKIVEGSSVEPGSSGSRTFQ